MKDLPRYHENSRLPRKVSLFGPRLLYHVIARPITWLLRKLGMQEPHGVENILEAERMAKERGVGILFVSNHTNEIDPFVVGLNVPRRAPIIPIYAVARVKERYKHYGTASMFFGGRLFWAGGSYPALQGLRDYSKALPFHETVLKRGRSVLIFLEGGISDAPLTIAKGGAGYLAAKTRAIILPVAVCGASNLPARELFAGKRRFFASYGKPILPESICKVSNDIDPESCKDGSRRILESIRAILVSEGYATENQDGTYRYIVR